MRKLLALALLLSTPWPAFSAGPPLTLDEALALAAQRSTDLEIARATRDSAGLELYRSYSGVLPRLDLTGSFGRRYYAGQRTLQPILDPSSPGYGGFEIVAGPSQEFEDYQLGLTLRWTIFDGFGSWNRIAAARASARAAERTFDEVTLSTAFEVTRRFYDLVKQQRIFEVRKEAAARSAELVARADALFAAGRGSKADTYSARVNATSDLIAVESQRAAVTRASSELAQAIGQGADADLAVVPPATLAGPGLPETGEPPPFDVLLERARKARPMLMARESLVAAADLQAPQAWATFWPTFAVEGTYFRQSTELTGSFGVIGPLSHQNTGAARATLTWNLFQGRESLAAVQRAAVEARRARADAAQREQVVSGEIARARQSTVTFARAAALAQESLKAAEMGLQLARDRLEAGVAGQLEVRDATVKLAEAKLNLVSALVDHAVARTDLNRAVGGSL